MRNVGRFDHAYMAGCMLHPNVHRLHWLQIEQWWRAWCVCIQLARGDRGVGDDEGTGVGCTGDVERFQGAGDGRDGDDRNNTSMVLKWWFT